MSMNALSRTIALLKPWYYFFACVPFILYSIGNGGRVIFTDVIGMLLLLCGLIAYHYRSRHEAVPQTTKITDSNNPFKLFAHFIMHLLFFLFLIVLILWIQAFVAYRDHYSNGEYLLGYLRVLPYPLLAYTLHITYFRISYSHRLNDLRKAYYFILCPIAVGTGTVLSNFKLYGKTTHLENVGTLIGFIVGTLIGIAGYYFMRAEQKPPRVIKDLIVN